MSDWRMEVVTGWKIGTVYLDRDGERYECVKLLDGGRPLFVSNRKSGKEVVVIRTPSGKITDGEEMTGDIVGEEVAGAVAETGPREFFAAEWDTPDGGKFLGRSIFLDMVEFRQHFSKFPNPEYYRPVRFVEDLDWRQE